MKKLTYLFTFVLFFGTATANDHSDLTKDFVRENPGIASVNALAFGPEGILFIGDSKNAAVYAIETGDNQAFESAEEISLERVDERIAEMLGTTAEKIVVQDMAVNPVSKNCTWPFTIKTEHRFC